MPIHSIPHPCHSISPIATLVLCALLIPVAVAAECPTTTLFLRGIDPINVIVFDVSDELSDPAGSIVYGKSSAKFDLVEGKLTAIAEVYEANDHVSCVIAHDDFTLHNVPAATFTVRLNLSFESFADHYRMAFAFAYAFVQADGDTADASSFGPNFARYIDIEVSALEGQPFPLTYEVQASGYGYYPYARVDGSIEFIGLPPEAAITSCHGFVLGPVSVEETTWGQIKALYR